MIVFKAHQKPVYSMEFSPDGRFLLTAGGDRAVRLWSDDRQLVREWEGSEFGWAPVAYSPDGRYVARGGYGIHVWPAEGPDRPVIETKHFVESVAFSPDGRVFAAHADSRDGLVRWAMPGGERLEGGWGGTRFSNEGQAFGTAGLAYHPGGSILATSSGVLGDQGYDSAIFLWDAETGTRVGELTTRFALSHPTALRFSPDGSLLAGLYGPTLRIWDIQDRVEVAVHQTGQKHFKGLAFTPDGRRLLTVHNDEMVRAWDTSSWSEAGSFAWKIGKLGAVAIAPDGCRVAAGGSTGKIVIWDAD